MSEATDLYELDFARWAEMQARALRDAAASGANLPVDWDNVAEEMDGLARRDRSEVRSRIETILEHLLKLRFSPASDPRAGWRATIRRTRSEIDDLLDDNRSMRRDIPDIVARISTRVSDRVAADLMDHDEVPKAVADEMRRAAFTEGEILGDWFPDAEA